MLWKNGSPERIGIGLAALAAFGFSFKAIFVKLAYAAASVEAVTLLSMRMMFSIPLFVIAGFSALRAGPALTRRDLWLLGGLGLVGYYGSSILDFIGLHYISAGLERLILFTYPTLTILIGVLFMGKALERRVVGAVLLSYIGIGFAFFHDLKISGEVNTVLIGAACVFGSALLYAMYSAGAEVAIHRLGSVRFSTLALLVSAAATQVHFFVSQPLSALVQPLPIYLYCAGMALFSTVLPIFWQSAAIRRIGAARAVLIGTLGPILTIFFSWSLLDEPISTSQMIGAAFVVAGVLLVSRRT